MQTITQTIHFITAASYLGLETLVIRGKEYLKEKLTIKTVKQFLQWCSHDLPQISDLKDQVFAFLIKQDTKVLHAMHDCAFIDDAICIKVLFKKFEESEKLQRSNTENILCEVSDCDYGSDSDSNCKYKPLCP